MKSSRLTVAIACLMLTVSVIAVTKVALASPPRNPADVCQGIQDAAPEVFDATFDSFGDCVSTIATNPIRLCESLKDAGLLGLFGFKNKGDCVSTLIKETR